ncbi:MAG: hypothetical protein ACXVCK_20955, partial [Bdellovibrionota bacterium]
EDAIIEVSYALTPEEIKVADAYHRVRRAAFYRVPFTFGDAENNMRLANMLDEGEHCFTFCKAEQVGNHVDELQGLLRASGVNDPEAFLARPDVKKFLAQAEELVLRTNDKRLNPKILTNNAGVRALLTKIAPAGVKGKPQKLQNFADALVGYDVTREYKTLMRNLNVTGDTGFQDMNNPRVTAVLIYEDPAKAKAFRNATYSTPGKFSSWTAAGQSVLKP